MIKSKVYRIVGNLITGRQVAKVVIPLDAAVSTRIASDQVFTAATSSGTLPDTYGPFLAAGINHTVTQTRPLLCFITPYVAALILESKSRTPRSILELLGPVLDFAHSPIFNWLRVAQTVGANGRALVTHSQLLSAPPREEVNHLIKSIVGDDLPLMGHFLATFVAQNEAKRFRR
jgi:hypothetical protein